MHCSNECCYWKLDRPDLASKHGVWVGRTEHRPQEFSWFLLSLVTSSLISNSLLSPSTHLSISVVFLSHIRVVLHDRNVGERIAMLPPLTSPIFSFSPHISSITKSSYSTRHILISLDMVCTYDFSIRRPRQEDLPQTWGQLELHKLDHPLHVLILGSISINMQIQISNLSKWLKKENFRLSLFPSLWPPSTSKLPWLFSWKILLKWCYCAYFLPPLYLIPTL